MPSSSRTTRRAKSSDGKSNNTPTEDHEAALREPAPINEVLFFMWATKFDKAHKYLLDKIKAVEVVAEEWTSQATETHELYQTHERERNQQMDEQIGQLWSAVRELRADVAQARHEREVAVSAAAAVTVTPTDKSRIDEVVQAIESVQAAQTLMQNDTKLLQEGLVEHNAKHDAFKRTVQNMFSEGSAAVTQLRTALQTALAQMRSSLAPLERCMVVEYDTGSGVELHKTGNITTLLEQLSETVARLVASAESDKSRINQEHAHAEALRSHITRLEQELHNTKERLNKFEHTTKDDAIAGAAEARSSNEELSANMINLDRAIGSMETLFGRGFDAVEQLADSDRSWTRRAVQALDNDARAHRELIERHDESLQVLHKYAKGQQEYLQILYDKLHDLERGQPRLCSEDHELPNIFEVFQLDQANTSASADTRPDVAAVAQPERIVEASDTNGPIAHRVPIQPEKDPELSADPPRIVANDVSLDTSLSDPSHEAKQVHGGSRRSRRLQRKEEHKNENAADTSFTSVVNEPPAVKDSEAEVEHAPSHMNMKTAEEDADTQTGVEEASLQLAEKPETRTRDRQKKARPRRKCATSKRRRKTGKLSATTTTSRDPEKLEKNQNEAQMDATTQSQEPHPSPKPSNICTPLKSLAIPKRPRKQRQAVSFDFCDAEADENAVAHVLIAAQDHDQTIRSPSPSRHADASVTSSFFEAIRIPLKPLEFTELLMRDVLPHRAGRLESTEEEQHTQAKQLYDPTSQKTPIGRGFEDKENALPIPLKLPLKRSRAPTQESLLEQGSAADPFLIDSSDNDAENSADGDSIKRCYGGRAKYNADSGRGLAVLRLPSETSIVMEDSGMAQKKKRRK